MSHKDPSTFFTRRSVSAFVVAVAFTVATLSAAVAWLYSSPQLTPPDAKSSETYIAYYRTHGIIRHNAQSKTKVFAYLSLGWWWLYRKPSRRTTGDEQPTDTATAFIDGFCSAAIARGLDDSAVAELLLKAATCDPTAARCASLCVAALPTVKSAADGVPLVPSAPPPVVSIYGRRGYYKQAPSPHASGFGGASRPSYALPSVDVPRYLQGRGHAGIASQNSNRGGHSYAPTAANVPEYARDERSELVVEKLTPFHAYNHWANTNPNKALAVELGAGMLPVVGGIPAFSRAAEKLEEGEYGKAFTHGAYGLVGSLPGAGPAAKAVNITRLATGTGRAGKTALGLLAKPPTAGAIVTGAALLEGWNAAQRAKALHKSNDPNYCAEQQRQQAADIERAFPEEALARKLSGAAKALAARLSTPGKKKPDQLLGAITADPALAPLVSYQGQLAAAIDQGLTDDRIATFLYKHAASHPALTRYTCQLG